MKFLAFNVDFSSSSPDPLGPRRPAQAGVKDSYPLKSGYFTAIMACSVNLVADRHRHAAIITSNSDKLFSSVNIDDFE